jgi:hypothetical protein
MITNLLQAQVTQAQPNPSDVVQGLIIAFLIIFIFDVFVTGFTAKKIENIHAPSYSKAFLATLLKNMLSWAGLAFMGLYLGANPIVVLVVVLALIPTVVYKLVFSSTMGEALVIAIVVLGVESLVGVSITFSGLFDFAQLLTT